MCGIFYFLKYSENKLKLKQVLDGLEKEIRDYYKRNNGGVVLTKDIDLESENFSYGGSNVTYDDLDFEFIFNGLKERGPDSMRCQIVNFYEDSNGEEQEIENMEDGFDISEPIQILSVEQLKAIITEPIQDKNMQIVIVSSVLSMRQQGLSENQMSVVEQPILIGSDIVLSYNGEIFDVDRKAFLNGMQELKNGDNNIDQIFKQKLDRLVDIVVSFDSNTHDSIYLAEILKNCQDLDIEIEIILQHLIGDYSMIITNLQNKKVKILKDKFGKRSLVFTQGTNFLVMSSLSPLSIEKMIESRIDTKNIEIDLDIKKYIKDNKDFEELNDQKLEKYKNSLKSKYFSNYIQILQKWSTEIPGNIMIELSLQQSTNQDNFQMTALSDSFHSLCYDQFDYSCLEEQEGEMDIEKLNLFDKNAENFNFCLKKVKLLLESSIESILDNVPSLKKDESLDDQTHIQSDAKIGILFSGGLDSSLIAYLTAKYLPSDEKIDLYNVSFKSENNQAADKIHHDRQIGIESYQELTSLFGEDKFNLILIDIKYEDEVGQKQKYSFQRIYPQSSLLDFNIGNVLNKASSRNGILFPKNQKIHSKARCVLDGLGADEIFGGYRRY